MKSHSNSSVSFSLEEAELGTQQTKIGPHAILMLAVVVVRYFCAGALFDLLVQSRTGQSDLRFGFAFAPQEFPREGK